MLRRPINARVSLLLLLLVAACSEGGATPPHLPASPPPAATDAAATGTSTPPLPDSFALTGDDRLVAFRALAGAVVAERPLGSPSPATAGEAPGRYLALTRDADGIFVLLPNRRDMATQIFAIDPGTFAVRAMLALDAVEGIFRGISVGRQTGHLYLFGNRPAALTDSTEDAIVVVVDPSTGSVLQRWLARAASGYDWRVYQGAVSADERQLFISYHGATTTGIDRFDVVGADLRRCAADPAAPEVGCIRAHGGFATYDRGLLVATGDRTIRYAPLTGGAPRAFDTGLAGNHLMEFALDVGAHRLYAAGACGYRGGYSVVDLDAPAGAPPLVLVAPDPSLCATHVALVQGDLFVALEESGGILVLNRSTGQVVRSLELPGAALDILPAATTAKGDAR